jgi:hypothetical protein
VANINDIEAVKMLEQDMPHCKHTYRLCEG